MEKLKFSPTIIEHAAYLIGRNVSAVSRDADLMASAHIEAYNRYSLAAVTVGMDIYNIEAEALGCTVQFYDDESIPGIAHHPFTLGSDSNQIRFSAEAGRIPLMLDAASMVKAAVKNSVMVNISVCGPISVLVGLLGYENTIEAFCDKDERVDLLLNAILGFLKDYIRAIASRGLGATIFESWAAPPLMSPDLFSTYAVPYEKELLQHMKEVGLPASPLVIGGETSAIIDDILKTGTTLLVSDYNTHLPDYVERAKQADLILRANLNPKDIKTGNRDSIAKRIEEIQKAHADYPNLLVGSGVVPYDTPPEHIMKVMEMLR